MLEIRIVYSPEDNRYYVYEGEVYIADEENLAEALIWFLSLVSKRVKVEDTNKEITETYGMVKKIIIL